MTDSSDKNSAFSDLEFRNVVALIEVLEEASLDTQDYIKRRFLERATQFEVTLEYLLDLDAIDAGNDGISLSSPMKAANRKSINSEVTAHLVQKESKYRKEAFDYLRHFDVTEGLATYKPPVSERSAERPVRNFLMEVGVIIYESPEDRYAISSENNVMFTLARAQFPRPISRLAFEAGRKSKEDIGYMAELMILDYERQRLGKDFFSKIEHVAVKNVAAGYDIKSISISSSGKELPRYVEVKAVAKSTYRFYWSANERDVAKVFGQYYFLYLLPVEKDRKMNSEDVMIIENPIVSVLESPDQWIIESDAIKCMLNPSPSN